MAKKTSKRHKRDERLLVYVPKEVKDSLRSQADKEHLTLSHYIFSILVQYAEGGSNG